MNEISALIKEALESFLVLFLPYKDTREVGILPPRGGPSPELDHAGTLILDIDPLEL